MLVGFGIRDSVSDIVHLQYTNLQHYDATIISDDDATDTEREALIESLDKNESLDHYTKIQTFKAHSTEWKVKFKCICVMFRKILRTSKRMLHFETALQRKNTN